MKMFGPAIWIIVALLVYIVLDALLFAARWLLAIVIVMAVGFWIARLWIGKLK